MIEYKYKASDGFNISVSSFHIEKAKGIVQIVHGLKEHKRRYYSFAEYLNSKGYSVFLSDNRGHGYSVDKNNPLGYMSGMNQLISDQYEINCHIKEQNNNLPVYMLGHSFGSMIARKYIQKYDETINGLILSGTVGFNGGVYAGLIISRIMGLLLGKNNYSRILWQIVDNGDVSWVCGNEDIMAEYNSDPFCIGYKYRNNAVHTILEGMRELHNIKGYQCKNPALPIMSIAGEKDPVTRYKAGIEDSMLSLRKAGYSSVKSIVYENMLHEVLNEKENMKVYEDVISFLNNIESKNI